VPKQALIIANSDYDDAHFDPLPAATADAVHLAEVLGDPTIGGFAVETLVDADQRTVMRTLESFFTRARSDDLLLLHLSVHGWKDRRGQLHFVVRDTERDFLGATAIPASFVNDRMLQSPSRRIVLMLDCCYSGAFSTAMVRRTATPPQVDVADPFSGNGRVVLTASTALQYAHEGEQEVRSSRTRSQPSVFTAAVVEGLRDGGADLDGDGLISISELYEYVNAQVAERLPDQSPTMSVDSAQGTIYVARSPRHAESDLLAELRGAVAERQAWKRIGALHLIERLLGSVREPTRNAARKALIGLIADSDREVASRALQLWQARGLGDPPVTTATRDTYRPQILAAAQPVVGIDFGTTNSAIGLLDAGDVRLIPNAEGALVTPSVVAITSDGRALIGAAAKRQAVTNPANTVRSVKLRLGTDWSIQSGDVRYTAEDIAALVLSQLQRDAEAYLGTAIYGAVLTVPAYFDQAQRYALSAAAHAAGVNVLRIINEPTAAAMTYGLNRQNDASTVLIFDLGGGTFDVSLLEIGDGVCEVKATAGDNHLGGDDWDQALADHLIQMVRRQHGVDLTGDPTAAQRLKEVAEAAKIELSSSSRTEIRLPYLTALKAGPVHLETTVTRSEFEAMTQGVLERCKKPIKQAIRDAGLKMSDLDHVILVGGATRMPAVGSLVKELTGGKQPYRGLIPEGVVTGAALEAGVIVGQVKDVLLLDVCPMSLGVETKGGLFTKLIERNTTIPTKWSATFTTEADNQATIVTKIYEGERETAADNKLLLALELTGLAPAPRGEPQIEIAFDIDANGILHVGAKDLGSGREASGTVNRDSVAAAARYRPSKGAWAPVLVTRPEHRP
jgi:molecular chaperone DnaK